MTSSVTISKSAPELESMQFDELRRIGLERITELSSTLWTDHNLHDPGITLLEALCYAITDLGYRLTFDIKDLLAASTGDATDYNNFFTARQILHNAPLTVNDYRKLLMDVVVEETSGGTTEMLGVKNAWLEIATDAEVKIYANMLKSLLEHKSTYAGEPSFFVKGLYNILLEFDNSEIHGDLNENTIKGTYTIEHYPDDENMEGVQFHITVGFPRWDKLLSNSSDITKIIEGIESFTVFIEEAASGYEIKVTYNTTTKHIEVTGERLTATGLEPILGISSLEAKLDDFILYAADSMAAKYHEKLEVIGNIIVAAGRKLNAHRNLCEDFYKVQALRIEEILLCADIEITTTANTNEVTAAIFHDISAFLSPEIYFYSLEEMQAKGLTTDEIFDGPALDHGFIDPEELTATERAKCIHASDLIRIIMNVEVGGKKPVIAVRNLQIANKPQDNADGSIDEVSVKWCLELAYDELYVPRLSEELSNLTFYKKTLPFGYDEDEMFAELEKLRKADRKRIPENPVLDITIPRGTWRETDSYTPVAEDLPLTYGVTSEGLKVRPVKTENLIRREAQANQLKAFLMFFDQLLEGLLGQVTGVKELFSMNAETNAAGKLLHGNKTYFPPSPLKSHPLDEHLVDDPTLVEALVQHHAESKAEFEERKNRFLDHLLARFCEQFTDYALLAYSIDGARAGSELIKDKLEFLNKYPEISANRGKAFNMHDGVVWSQQNVSGYEKRSASLVGVNSRKPASLFFTKAKFVITGLDYVVRKTAADKYLKNIEPFVTREALLENLESVVAAGIFRHNYTIIESPAGSGKYFFMLYGDTEKKEPIAVSFKNDYTEATAKAAIAEAIKICREEFLNQPGANRKNLAPPIDAYIKFVVTADLTATPQQYVISYKLYTKPFDYTAANLLIEGELRGNAATGDTEAQIIDKGRAAAPKKLWDMLRFASDEDNYGFFPPYDPYGSNYKFVISDSTGIIGRSKEKNFNAPLAAIIENANPPKVTISGASANNGVYTVSNAVASGPDVKLTISETLAGANTGGILLFEETFSASAIKTSNAFVVIGKNLTDRITAGDKLYFEGTKDALKGNYTVTDAVLNGADTEIYVDETLLGSDAGTIKYTAKFKIKTASASKIIIRGGWEQKAVKKCVEIIRLNLLEREGLLLLEHVLLRPRHSTQVEKAPPDTFDDKLMSIHIDTDCEECRINDVYSFVMSLVLPYWPQRFRDRHLREFIETTLRTEAPAHLAMNICWISPEQMYRFEQCYKQWLIDNGDKPENDTLAAMQALKMKRGNALKNLIEILEQLRTVYPEGRLHSCDESGNDALKGAIILNNTMLGTM